MVESTWGDWFVREEVEAADVGEGVACWYLGCNGFVLRSAEATVYIDPYFAGGEPPWTIRMIPVPMDPADATTADAVLATHEHIDHIHPPSYGPLVEDLGATVYGAEPCWDGRQDYEGEMIAEGAQRRVIEPGDDFEVGDFTVHVRGANDPDADGDVSYVIEHEAGTFFHGGDSRPAEAFAEVGAAFDIDLGALAFGSIGHIYFPEDKAVRRTQWYMGENEIIECANVLGLDRLVPTHYDMWRGMDADPKVLHEHATTHEHPRVVERVKVGDRLDWSEPGLQRAEYLR